MAKTDKSKGKPESNVKTETVKPLEVEITFPLIMDLKQAIGMDADGNLIIGIQFKAKVDQFEVFRLINLLKQPHGTLYAVIGSPQSAMDFKFDAKQIRFEIFQATERIEAAKSKKPKVLEEATVKPAADQEPAAEGMSSVMTKLQESQVPAAVKIHAVAFNHIPEEKKPYGVAIDYVGEDGSGEVHTVAGRGKNPTEAVMASVLQILPDGVKEPFEAMTALEKLEPSAEGYKLIRAIQVGSFDEEGKEEGEGGK